MISDTESVEKSDDKEKDLAGKRLRKAIAQKKKHFQKVKNILGRTIEQRKAERLTTFKAFWLVFSCVISIPNFITYRNLLEVRKKHIKERINGEYSNGKIIGIH